MVVAKLRLAAAAAGLVLLAAFAQAGGQEDRAAEFLRRSMGNRFPSNVVAIIMQRDPNADGTYQRVKVTRAKDGRARHVVLQPLRMAGVESVDNGETFSVYLPDKKTLIVQESPLKMNSDVDERLALARRNYNISVGGRERIAGRTSICIVADPKDPDLALRRYYLDEKSGYPLKMEVAGERGSLKVVFDTVAIDYPEVVSQGVFQLSPAAGAKTIRYTRPKPVTSQAEAMSIVGFRPVVPDRLPMGFKVQEMQYNGSKEWKSVVVRLTDGLIRATVYQWKPDGKKIESVEDSSFLDVNGLRFLLVSDLPEPIRMRLLQAFAGQAKNDDHPRAMRLIGMLVPSVPTVTHPELMSAIWTFAQLDNRAGLANTGLPVGFPVYGPLH